MPIELISAVFAHPSIRRCVGLINTLEQLGVSPAEVSESQNILSSSTNLVIWIVDLSAADVEQSIRSAVRLMHKHNIVLYAAYDDQSFTLIPGEWPDAVTTVLPFSAPGWMWDLQLQLTVKRQQSLKVAVLSVRRQIALLREQHAVGAVQRSLIPASGSVIGKLGFNYRLQKVSPAIGCHLNVVTLSSRYTGFYVLDMSARGALASLRALMLARMLSDSLTDGVLVKTDESGAVTPRMPSEVLRLLNVRFCEQGRNPWEFSITYGVWDQHTEQITVATAGLYGPVLAAGHNAPILIGHAGPPIGLSRDAVYGDATVSFDRGDRLALSSMRATHMPEHVLAWTGDQNEWFKSLDEDISVLVLHRADEPLEPVVSAEPPDVVGRLLYRLYGGEDPSTQLLDLPRAPADKPVLLVCGAAAQALIDSLVTDLETLWELRRSDCLPSGADLQADQISVVLVSADAWCEDGPHALHVPASHPTSVLWVSSSAQEPVPDGVDDVVFAGLSRQCKQDVQVKLKHLAWLVELRRQAGRGLGPDKLSEQSKALAALQRQVLPGPMLRFDRFRFDWVYQPARRIGSSHLSVLPLAPDHVMFLMVQVPPNTLGAGIYAWILARLLSHELYQSPADIKAGTLAGSISPAHILDTLGSKLHTYSQGRFSCQALLGVLDTHTGCAQIATAGAVGFSVLTQAHQWTHGYPASAPLGSATAPSYINQSVQMHDLDRMVIMPTEIYRALDDAFWRDIEQESLLGLSDRIDTHLTRCRANQTPRFGDGVLLFCQMGLKLGVNSRILAVAELLDIHAVTQWPIDQVMGPPVTGIYIAGNLQEDTPFEIAQEVGNLVYRYGCDRQSAYYLELAIVELCTNIKRHGGNTPERLAVQARCVIYARSVVFFLTDQGSSIPKAVLEKANAFDFESLDFDISNAPEDGLGLPLIHTIMDKVSYVCENNVNYTTLIKSW